LPLSGAGLDDVPPQVDWIHWDALHAFLSGAFKSRKERASTLDNDGSIHEDDGSDGGAGEGLEDGELSRFNLIN